MINQHHGWHKDFNNGHSLYSTIYASKGKDCLGVTIIAPPIGPEYMHCQASIRNLAFSLAEQGQKVVVFDWPGYGNSTGLLPLENSVDIFSSALNSIVSHWSEEACPPSLVCIRSSCLIGINAINENRLHTLVLWYPYTQGKAFIRDLELIDDSMGNAPGGIEIVGGGYPIQKDDTDAFALLMLKELVPLHVENLSVVHTAETKRLPFLKSINLDQSSIRKHPSTGLGKMARQAEKSIVPTEDIETIVTDICTKNPQNCSPSILIDSDFENDQFKETTVRFGNRQFGVLTSPIENTENHCLIIPNTGSGHQVGPNGVHREIARTLARNSIACMRFDLRHLGSSGTTKTCNSNEAYTAHSAEDINQCYLYLASIGFSKISLFGICSGAYGSFQSALTFNDAYEKLFLVNPDTLYWAAGDDPHIPTSSVRASEDQHHKKQLSNISAWFVLLRSPNKWGRLIIKAGSIVARRINSAVKPKKLTASKFELDMSLISERVKNTWFIFSPNESGHLTLRKNIGEHFKLLQDEGKAIILEQNEGDHTFSKSKDRTNLVELIARKLTT